MNQYLGIEFFKSLGESPSLRYLNISESGAISNTHMENLGKAIAFNAFKRGSLENIDLSKGVISGGYAGVNSLY